MSLHTSLRSPGGLSTGAPTCLRRGSRPGTPGGALIVTVPSARLKLTPKHRKHYSPDELSALLGGSFPDVKIEGLYRRAFFSRLWFNVLSLLVLVLRPVRGSLPRLFDGVAGRHWNFFGKHLAAAHPSRGDYLLDVASSFPHT